MRYRLYYKDGKWVRKEPEETKEGKAPYVIADEMEGLEHPATGEIITSKRRFRRITRERGYYEVGNEKLKPKRIEVGEREIKDKVHAIYECLASGNSDRIKEI